MTTDCALYCRISDDRAGAGLGVKRQEDDCRLLAERRGWEVTEVYVDNDLSAYSGKPRPAYRRLCDDVEAGKVKALIAWHPDRLHRSPKELETFIDLVEASGCQVATVQAGDLDLSTPTGRMTARIVGAVARHESEHKSERIRRQKAQAVQDGKPNGGGRCFGYASDGRTIIEAEAALIRKAAQALLDGASCRSIALSWNDLGVTTPRGNGWSPQVVRRMLLAPRLAGLREHRGEIVGSADWSPILEEKTWWAVRGLLTRQPGKAHPRKWAWASVLVCGICGAPLRSAVVNGKRGWSCKKLTTPTACGRITVQAEPLEAHLEQFLFQVWPMVAESRSSQVDEAALVGISGQLDDLEQARFVDGNISEAGYLKARATLIERRDALLREVTTEALTVRRDWPGWWASASVQQRKAAIGQVIVRVVVNPALHRGARFDGRRVEIHLNGDGEWDVLIEPGEASAKAQRPAQRRCAPFSAPRKAFGPGVPDGEPSEALWSPLEPSEAL